MRGKARFWNIISASQTLWEVCKCHNEFDVTGFDDNSTKNERLKALRRRVDIKYLETDVNSWLFYCSFERSQILKPKIVVIKVYGKVFKNKKGEKINM
eukprot:Pgem_evm1s16269